jgi:hypothetical protein
LAGPAISAWQIVSSSSRFGALPNMRGISAACASTRPSSVSASQSSRAMRSSIRRG